MAETLTYRAILLNFGRVSKAFFFFLYEPKGLEDPWKTRLMWEWILTHVWEEDHLHKQIERNACTHRKENTTPTHWVIPLFSCFKSKLGASLSYNSCHVAINTENPFCPISSLVLFFLFLWLPKHTMDITAEPSKTQRYVTFFYEKIRYF